MSLGTHARGPTAQLRLSGPRPDHCPALDASPSPRELVPPVAGVHHQTWFD